MFKLATSELESASMLRLIVRRISPCLAWLLAAIVLVMTLMLWSESARAQTRRGEQAIASVMSLRADPANGADLYARHCASCHGPLGLGNAANVTPALAGQWERYVVKQLTDVSENDRGISEMHRVLARRELVEPQSVRDLAAFVHGLQPNRRNETGDGKRVARGKQLFASLCAACHGEGAQGNDRAFMPSLRHQHYSYLLSQMRQLAAGHRYSVDIQLIESLEQLPLPDLMALADAISRTGRTVGARVPDETNGRSHVD